MCCMLLMSRDNKLVSLSGLFDKSHLVILTVKFSSIWTSKLQQFTHTHTLNTIIQLFMFIFQKRIFNPNQIIHSFTLKKYNLSWIISRKMKRKKGKEKKEKTHQNGCLYFIVSMPNGLDFYTLEMNFQYSNRLWSYFSEKKEKNKKNKVETDKQTLKILLWSRSNFYLID